MDPNAILPLSGDRQAAAEAKRGVVEGTDAKGGVVSVVERSRLGAPAWQPSNVATSTKPVRVRLKLRLLVLRPNALRFSCGRPRSRQHNQTSSLLVAPASCKRRVRPHLRVPSPCLSHRSRRLQIWCGRWVDIRPGQTRPARE